MIVRAFVCAVLVLAPACGAGGEDPVLDRRLVPPGDGDYQDLETPEESGECEFDDECEVSCVHTCVPVNDGPVTCPDPPDPVPERVEGAACRCAGAVCAYFE